MKGKVIKTGEIITLIKSPDNPQKYQSPETPGVVYDESEIDFGYPRLAIIKTSGKPIMVRRITRNSWAEYCPSDSVKVGKASKLYKTRDLDFSEGMTTAVEVIKNNDGVWVKNILGNIINVPDRLFQGLNIPENKPVKLIMLLHEENPVSE